MAKIIEADSPGTPALSRAARSLVCRAVASDEITERNGWRFHTDTIHPNSRGGKMLADLVQRFTRRPDRPTLTVPVTSSGMAFSRRESTDRGQFEYWRPNGNLRQKIDEGANLEG
jgi:hypothetical protein